MQVYGIDLGTTYSACQAIDPGSTVPTEVALDGQDYNDLPSVVYLRPEDDHYAATVGREAEKRAEEGSDGVLIREAKRFIGVKGEAQKLWTKGGITIDPVEVSALILRKIRQQTMGHDSTEPMYAVVTHPRDFDLGKKDLTKEAAQLAGIQLLDTLNEPEAAAYAYFEPGGEREPGLYVVFDLGGGTLDIAILDVPVSGPVKVVGGAGDPHLGGCDWDAKMRELLLEDIAAYTGWAEPLRLERKCEFRLRNLVREQKHSLAKLARAPRKNFEANRAESTEPGVMVPLNVEIGRFNERCAGLVEKCRAVLDRALADSHRTRDDVMRVLPVGGSSRLRAVRQLLEDMFPGRVVPFEEGPNPDFAVAQGAARYASFRAVQEKIGIGEGDGESELIIGGDAFIEGTVPKAINVLNSRTENGARQEWLVQIVPQNSPAPLPTPVVVPLVVKTPAAHTVIKLFEGPAGAIQPGRTAALTLTFPPSVRSKKDDTIRLTVQVGRSGRIQASATYADGTIVQGDTEAEDNAKDQRSKRSQTMQKVVVR